MSDEKPPDEPDQPDDRDEDEGVEEDAKGFGLTEEFARLESEIEREAARGSEPGRAEDDAVDGESSEWAPPPLEAADDEEPVEAAADGEDDDESPEGEPEDDESDLDPSEDDSAATPPADSDEAVHDGIPDAPADAEETAVESPATEHTVVRDHPLPPVPIAAAAAPEDIKDKTPALWWRFMTGSVMIVATVATSIVLAFLFAFNGIADDLQVIDFKDPNLITEIDPGKPQTILIVGSDKRSNTPGDPGRSDTTMLLRVDAENKVLSLFSLPRDLKVDIPGYGTAKLNEAYSDGGVEKTTETVKDLTGLDINHVVNVDFQGFADAVDAIDCVYVDVDRDYFNDNSTAYSAEEQYAAIDVNAGYQRLCGQNALDYVRYRHTDNDFVRAARQQDFLRNAKAQVPVSEVLPIVSGSDTGSKLLDIFTEYTSSDVDSPAKMISVLKAFIGVKDVPIKEIHFNGADTIENGIAYVTASQADIDKAVNEFLGEEDSAGGPAGGSGKSDGGKSEKPKPDPEPEPTDGSGADVVPAEGVVSCGDGVAGKVPAFGRTSARRLNFPIYVPEVLAPGSCYDDGSRQYEIKNLDDKKEPAYKMVVALETAGDYYGVMGTTWSDPPILDNPTDTVTIDDRDYDVYYDGDRLRLVAFHDDDGNSYWVTNTLLQTLGENQMLAIAASMDKKKQ